MSSYSAEILVDAQDRTGAVYDSVSADNEFYPENPVRTEMRLGKKLRITVESEHLPHLRANLNSTLRLIQASYDSIESAGRA